MDESTDKPSPPAPEPGPVKKVVEKIATAEAKQQMPRMWLWWIALAAFLGVLIWKYPNQISNAINKNYILTESVIATYFIDRMFFLFTKLKFDENLQDNLLGAARVLSRPIIFLGVCVVLALTV